MSAAKINVGGIVLTINDIMNEIENALHSDYAEVNAFLEVFCKNPDIHLYEHTPYWLMPNTYVYFTNIYMYRNSDSEAEYRMRKKLKEIYGYKLYKMQRGKKGALQPPEKL